MGIRAAISAGAFAVGITAILPASGQPRPELSDDPFAFLRPTIQFSEDERHKLDDRQVVIKILPADGHELAAMAAASLDAGPEALVRSVRNIVDLEKSALIPQLGRFSPQPRLDDLRALTLEDVDIAEIRQCEPGHCGLKLEADEIARLQRVVSGTDGTDSSRGEITQELRRIMLARAQRYLQRGDERTAAQFATLLQHSPYLRARLPALVASLERYRDGHVPGVESFLYWSKEMYAWKPMITITHLTIRRGDGANGEPEVAVASRDIFSTRYTSGTLTLMLLLRSPDSSRRYLVYINRTWVDGVRALWRPIVEHRIKKQARTIFADVRARIERGANLETASRAEPGNGARR
jgi:hypothetical protein